MTGPELPSVVGPPDDQQRRVRDVVLVVLMLVVAAVLHSVIPSGTLGWKAAHEFLQRLYYVPILYAAFRFGKRGGIVTGVAAALLFVPHVMIDLGGFSANAESGLEVVMYVVIGGLFGHLRDIEDRRAADLMQVSRKLEEAYGVLEDRAMQLISIQDYTQAILRSVTSGVLTVGHEGSVATANAAAERIMGAAEADMVARPFTVLFKDDGGLSTDLSRVLSGRLPRTMRDVRLVTSAGTTVHAQTSVSRMRDVGGRRLGAVVTIEDVSQIKALTDQLIRADRLAAMGQLTAGVAHEVRNPLGIIRASVQLMEDAGCSPERIREATGVIKHEIDRLDRVIKALLDFGRPAPPTMRPVSVAQVLDDVVLFTRRFASQGSVELVEDFSRHVPCVMADTEQLKQVFLNLVKNSVQAMSESGGTLKIETGAEDEFVFVRFTDTGPGMAPGEADRVFDPFYSTKDDGTGLGLTIVHRIIDEHGGHIGMSTEEGIGTAVTVHLPALT